MVAAGVELLVRLSTDLQTKTKFKGHLKLAKARRRLKVHVQQKEGGQEFIIHELKQETGAAIKDKSLGQSKDHKKAKMETGT